MTMTAVRTTEQTITTYHYQEAVCSLREILIRHKGHFTDPLSIRLFRWGATVLKPAVFNQEEKEDATGEIVSIPMEKMRVLVQKILVNPLDGAPLKDPVLERKTTWEVWMHREYKKHFALSPLDDGAMLENPPVHLLARDMIQWANISAPPTGTPALVPFSTQLVPRDHSEGRLIQSQMENLARNPQLAGMQRYFYLKIAQNAVLIEQNKSLREEMESVLERADQFVSEMHQASQMIVREAEEHAEAHQEEIRAQIESVNQIHQQAVSELNERINWIEQTHQQTISNLEQRRAAMEAANAAAAATLQTQIARMNQEHEQISTTLRAQIQSIHAAHHQAVSTLESKIHSVHVDIEKHKAKVGHLENQLSKAEKQIRQESEQNAIHLAQIHDLRAANAKGTQEISRLNRKINDLDDNDCFLS